MEKKLGRSRSDEDKVVALRPIQDDFPIGGEILDAQTRAYLLTFSENAKIETQKLVRAYLENLVNTAVDIKNVRQGDNVSAANVREASFTFNQRKEKGMAKLVGVLGGVLLGTGFSTLASMIQSGTFTRGGTILAVLTVAIGGFFIAIDLSEGLLDTLRRRKTPDSR